MNKAICLDIDALLVPVTEESPTGSDLREDHSPGSDYRALRDARTIARNNERSALANGQTLFINPADWESILDQAPAVLQHQSKDIEVATWLIEALTRVHGFEGLSAGFSLVRKLIENFNSELHPRPDEDGIASQLTSLLGLNGFGGEGTLIAPIRAIPLTGEGTSVGPFAAWQCEQAFELERVSDPAKRESRLAQGVIARPDIDQAVIETSDEYLHTLNDQLHDAIAEYKSFQEVLNEYCKDDPQPTSKILEMLEACLQTLNYIASDRLVVEEISEQEESDDDAVGTFSGKNKIDTREAALGSLRDVAAYFRRTEPHSPISYAIEQAVYWSQLALPALIQELIPDEGARSKYQNLTGIRKVGD